MNPLPSCRENAAKAFTNAGGTGGEDYLPKFNGLIYGHSGNFVKPAIRLTRLRGETLQGTVRIKKMGSRSIDSVAEVSGPTTRRLGALSSAKTLNQPFFIAHQIGKRVTLKNLIELILRFGDTVP